MKICKCCNKEQENINFRKNRNECKLCEKEKIKKWRKENKNHIKNYNKNYFQNHKEELKEKRKEYLYEYRQTEKYKKHKKEYANKNKEKTNIQTKIRLQNDYNFKLKHQIRNLLNKCFKRKYKKSIKTEKILDCDIDYFINHLLKTFKNNYGYEWDDKEPVHIDHIIPLATAQTEEEILKLCHYTNLQLLKATDNLKKSNKKDYKI